MHENSKDGRRRAGRRHDWLADAGGPPRTPLGSPVVSRFAALSERIQADLRAFGSGPHSPCSAYRLQTLYLDFGRRAKAQELIDSVVRAFEVPHPATPAALDPQLVEAARHGLGDLDDLVRWRGRLPQLSGRALMTALVFDAHFWNIRLALEVVAGERPLERFATATCAFVAEQRVGHGLEGDPRYYAPLPEREPAFCYDSCLPAAGAQSPQDSPGPLLCTQGTCGMLRVLEGFRFFASFPDEP